MNKKGFSIIEILVAVAIFSGVALLTTQSVSQTLKTTRKSDSLVRIRENLNYSLAVFERQIRQAEDISPCTGASSSSISYTSIEGTTSAFTCMNIGAAGYIASGSANIRLTSDDIAITACSFACTQIDINEPPVVRISVTAEDAVLTGIEKAVTSVTTEIIARNY